MLVKRRHATIQQSPKTNTHLIDLVISSRLPTSAFARLVRLAATTAECVTRGRGALDEAR
jgi:hypothetical protein